MLVVGIDVDPEHEEELNRWYDSEHIPQRLGIPGFVRARRLVRAAAPHTSGNLKGTPDMPRYLALYEVTDPKVFETVAYRKLVDNPTPWTIRMRDTFELRIRGIYVETLSMSADDPAVEPFRVR
ncbi:MAG TPA: hypothetical protein VKQ27_02655 [Acetobacteraceae bacterium]|nr:hypothetical protein [Acetobacteraceae bacterium]